MRILYLSQSGDPVNIAYVRGLQENGVGVLSLIFKPQIRDFIKLAKFYFKEKNNFDLIIVGFSSPQLTIFANLISDHKIIYNAFLSSYERMIISRKLAPRFSLKAVYYWLSDFLAAHSADLIVVETEHQADFFKKNFKVSEKKVFRGWAGIDENKFFYDSAVSKFDDFTVLFRGAFLPEAGVEYAIKAAKVLEKEKIRFIVIGGGHLLEKTRKLVAELKPANLEFITDFLPSDKLRETMQKCHLSLGQLADHVRLTRTIPYKAFESLAMKLPYLTAANSGILELLTPDKTCLTCRPADVKSLTEKIWWAKNNYSQTESIAENGYWLYQNQLTSRVLAAKLINEISKKINHP